MAKLGKYRKSLATLFVRVVSDARLAALVRPILRPLADALTTLGHLLPESLRQLAEKLAGGLTTPAAAKETVGSSALAGPSRTINRIGDLSAEHRRIVIDVWDGKQPVTALPHAVREQLAELYSHVAASNPPGSAQAVFNDARARFLRGQGPHPGNNVNDFAARHGLSKFKRE